MPAVQALDVEIAIGIGDFGDGGSNDEITDVFFAQEIGELEGVEAPRYQHGDGWAR